MTLGGIGDLNGTCQETQITSHLSMVALIYDTLGIARIQWTTDNSYYSSSGNPKISWNSQFI
jgi:hypothetical protein